MNVEIHVGTELVDLDGDGKTLTGAVVREHVGGACKRYDIHHLFLFIGATPHTQWLDGAVAMDPKGVILTGEALPLQTGIPGCSPLATSAPVRPSGSQPRWAMAQSPSLRSMAIYARR